LSAAKEPLFSEGWEERIREIHARRAPPGVIPREVWSQHSGLELLQGMLEGKFPDGPINETAGFMLTVAEPGRVVFHAMPTVEYYNSVGVVHGGWASTLLDSSMACAIQTTIARGQSYTTMELKVNFVRPLFETTGPVMAEGRVIHAGRQMATAESRLVDSTGKLYAHGTTTCLIFAV
jgi:uncharacterized protein (TIGR00369 family)